MKNKNQYLFWLVYVWRNYEHLHKILSTVFTNGRSCIRTDQRRTRMAGRLLLYIFLVFKPYLCFTYSTPQIFRFSSFKSSPFNGSMQVKSLQVSLLTQILGMVFFPPEGSPGPLYIQSNEYETDRALFYIWSLLVWDILYFTNPHRYMHTWWHISCLYKWIFFRLQLKLLKCSVISHGHQGQKTTWTSGTNQKQRLLSHQNCLYYVAVLFFSLCIDGFLYFSNPYCG